MSNNYWMWVPSNWWTEFQMWRRRIYWHSLQKIIFLSILYNIAKKCCKGIQIVILWSKDAQLKDLYIVIIILNMPNKTIEKTTTATTHTQITTTNNDHCYMFPGQFDDNKVVLWMKYCFRCINNIIIWNQSF